jgi:hypothetical protein
MESIGDYRDNQIAERITELLHEYNELFPTKLSNMRGLVGEI